MDGGAGGQRSQVRWHISEGGGEGCRGEDERRRGRMMGGDGCWETWEEYR